MEKSIIKAFIFLIVSIALLSGCKHATSDDVDADPTDTSSSGFALVDNLFVQTASSTTTGETDTAFQTNNAKYWSENGYSLWTAWGDEATTDTFTERTVRMEKISGNKYAGYGILICEGTRTGSGISMLLVMINTQRLYTIGKVVDGKYTSLFDWEASSYINGEYGISNTIKVTYDTSTSEFSLYINGNFVQVFKDDDVPLCTGGRNGYVVVISPQDSFPGEYVDVKFHEKI